MLEMLEKINNAKSVDRIHIDIDEIRIELPLPSGRAERIVVANAIRESAWKFLSLNPAV